MNDVLVRRIVGISKQPARADLDLYGIQLENRMEVIFKMTMNGRWIKLIGLAVASVISCNVSATVKCSVALPVVTFVIPATLKIVPDTPLGTILSPWLESPEGETHTNCIFSDKSKAGTGAKASGSYLSNITVDGVSYEVFKTPSVGLGYIFRGRDRHGVFTPIKRVFSGFIYKYSDSYDTRFSVRLVSTGERMEPGPVPSFQAGEFRVTEGKNYSAPSLLFMPATSIVGETCTISTGGIQFKLPKISIKNLPNIGSVAGEVTEVVQLNCKSDLTVRMVITDVTSPGNRSPTLTLSPESTGSGVGIELLHNGVKVRFGPDSSIVGTENQFLVGENVSGSRSISLMARYVRTSATLKAGSVHALATFTMSYQ